MIDVKLDIVVVVNDCILVVGSGLMIPVDKSKDTGIGIKQKGNKEDQGRSSRRVVYRCRSMCTTAC